ncbi:putative manganese transporter [Nocardioides sp. TF02-7]|nr:putative manganese transporter [Nocardioides sp. TF02-7]
MVVALYARGAVSYGAAVAALVATMGDATWLLLAADPTLTLQLKLLLLATGAVTGYVVDALGIAPRLRVDRLGIDTAPPDPGGAPAPTGARAGTAYRQGERPRSAVPASAAARLAVTPDGALAAPVPLAGVGAVPILLWASLAAAAVVAVPATFRLFDPALVGQAFLGGVDPYLALGLAGAAVSLVAFVHGGCKVADDDARTAHPSSTAEVLRQGGQEVAFITVWVSVAYVAWAVLEHVTGFDGTQLPRPRPARRRGGSDDRADPRLRGADRVHRDLHRRRHAALHAGRQQHQPGRRRAAAPAGGRDPLGHAGHGDHHGAGPGRGHGGAAARRLRHRGQVVRVRVTPGSLSP